MKITMVTNSLLPADREGGTAHSNFYLSAALRQAGAEVLVVTTDRNGTERLSLARDEWITKEDLSIFYAGTRPGAWIQSRSYRDAVSRAISESDVCIMSGVFWTYTGLVAALACREHRVPYVTIPRGLLSPVALRHKYLKKKAYWLLVARRIVVRSAAVVALAQKEMDDIRAAGIEVRGYVVPNGAYLEDFSDVAVPPASSSASSRREQDGKRYILFLGRLHKIKGLDLLLAAFEQVARKHLDVSLLIAGTADESYAAEFGSLIAGSSVPERIHLVGNVSGARKAGLLVGASVFALTSYSEGLPVAVLEALAAGVPVVITRNCNLPEVAEAEAGVEVMPDVPAIVQGLERVLSDERLRATMGENARRLAARSFSWESVGQRVLEICRTVASKP